MGGRWLGSSSVDKAGFALSVVSREFKMWCRALCHFPPYDFIKSLTEPGIPSISLAGQHISRMLVSPPCYHWDYSHANCGAQILVLRSNLG